MKLQIIFFKESGKYYSDAIVEVSDGLSYYVVSEEIRGLHGVAKTILGIT